jgi:hypothetical protein
MDLVATCTDDVRSGLVEVVFSIYLLVYADVANKDIWCELGDIEKNGNLFAIIITMCL